MFTILLFSSLILQKTVVYNFNTLRDSNSRPYHTSIARASLDFILRFITILTMYSIISTLVLLLAATATGMILPGPHQKG